MPLTVSALVRVTRSLWARHLHSSNVLNARKKLGRRPRRDDEEDLSGVKGLDVSRMTLKELKDTDAGPFQDLFNKTIEKYEAAAQKRKRKAGK